MKAESMNVPVTLTERAASAATYGGSAGAIFGGINANWVAAIGGIVIGLAGLAINVYFKYQHLKLAREKAQANPDE